MKTAEEILDSYLKTLLLRDRKAYVSIEVMRSFPEYPTILKAMQEYAEAFHKEKLRKELIKLLENEQVSLTYGIEEIEDIVDEYLKNKP